MLQKVNQYYPDISLNDKVTNFYSDEKIIDSKQEFNLERSKFSSYKISIAQDNQKLLFEFVSEINGKIYGNVTKFKGKYIRTTFTENKSEVQVSVDGKAVYKKKI